MISNAEANLAFSRNTNFDFKLYTYIICNI